MPLVRNVIGGAQVIASAKIERRFAVFPVAGASSTQAEAMLQVNTQPSCSWYAIMTAGPAGTTFTPQFAADNTGVNLTVPNWFDLTIPQLLVIGVPFFFKERIATNMISGIVTVPGGGADATVQIILSSSM